MNKHKSISVKTAEELADFLGLSPAEGVELDFRAELNDKIINIVKRKKITHAQLAQLAKTSRTRITALLNRNTIDISTDLMLRVLASLGYKARLKISKVA